MGTGFARAGVNGKAPQLRFPLPKAKPPERTRAVCTWIPEKEYDTFAEIAKGHGVNVSTYLRAIINDALAEEGPKVKTLFTE